MKKYEVITKWEETDYPYRCWVAMFMGSSIVFFLTMIYCSVKVPGFDLELFPQLFFWMGYLFVVLLSIRFMFQKKQYCQIDEKEKAVGK